MFCTNGEYGREQEEAQHLRSAHLEERQARAEADRREEGDHERALQRRVESDERDALAAREAGRRPLRAARRAPAREVVAPEHRHESPQSFAEEQRDARERERLHEI
jgi:hypothetical protein